MEVRHIAVDRINGFERRPSGVYVPGKAELKKVLDKAKSDLEKKAPINYLPFGNEINSLGIAKKISQAVLLVGPTGVGKSMLARKMALEWDMPFLYITCDPDKTEGKIMGRPDVVFGSFEVGGKVETMPLQHFRPSSISTAGLSGEPVVLFIDELHKLRKNVDALFHPLINEREVNLSDHLGPGEVYSLHRDTVVIFALNPYYGDAGIETVGPAMRQRVKTLYFPMVTDADKMIQIVEANVGDIKGHRQKIESICQMCAAISRVYLESRREGTTGQDDLQIKTQLSKVLSTINEAPSPRIVVKTTEAILAGQPADDAVLEGIFNPITNDFGSTARALTTIAHDVYGI